MSPLFYTCLGKDVIKYLSYLRVIVELALIVFWTRIIVAFLPRNAMVFTELYRRPMSVPLRVYAILVHCIQTARDIIKLFLGHLILDF